LKYTVQSGLDPGARGLHQRSRVSKPTETDRPARRGFLILFALGVAAVVVFNLQAIRDLTRSQIDIVALIEEAPGVRVGTEVWAEGVKVGRVKQVMIQKHDDAAMVALDLRVDARATTIITASSDVRASRQRFIGEPIVRLFAGAPGDLRLQSGDTIIGVPRPSPEALLDRAMELPPMLDSLVHDARLVQAQIEARRPHFDQLASQLEALGDATSGLAALLDEGSLGRMLDGRTGALARVGALRLRVSELSEATARMIDRYSPTGDVGLAAQLDALARRARNVEASLARLEALVDEGDGFVARAQADTAIEVAVRGVQIQLDSLMAEAHSVILRMFLP
jgi:hypothetical protein